MAARRHRCVLFAATLVLTVTACGGSDSNEESDEAAADGTTTEAASTDTDSDADSDADSDVTPDPVAVEACLEGAGLLVLNQDEVDSPYSAAELDFFDLDTELLVEGGDAEYFTGSINFYRTLDTAEAQEVIFEESVTDYTVGRAGTIVYTLVGGTGGGEVDTITATIDGCLTGA